MFTKSLDRCYNIARLRERAAKRMPAAMFHYIDGAAGDEWTMRRNTEAFNQYELVPRFLVDVSEIDLSTSVFVSPKGFLVPSPNIIRHFSKFE